MENVLLGIGGNLGNVAQSIAYALQLLSKHIENLRRSALFRTAPHFDKPGAAQSAVPDYINAALAGSTRLSPEELLDFVLGAENKLGRTRSFPCAPRVIDIDILLFGASIIDTPRLTVPHPRMTARNFVLVPAAQIAADWIHPVCNKTIADLCAECPDALAIKPCAPEDVFPA